MQRCSKSSRRTWLTPPRPLLIKKNKRKQTSYPTESQLRLLDVCGYKGYNEPLAFESSSEANRFVDNWNNKKTKFLETHSKMLAPSISGYIFNWLF
jgi:hypothetical protein